MQCSGKYKTTFEGATMKNYMGFLGLLFSSSLVQAVDYNNTKIVEVATYSSFNNGDVIVKTAADDGECVDGFWMDKEDPGYNGALTSAVAALHSKKTVYIEGDESQRWIGSPGGKHCHLYLLKTK